MLDKTKKLTGLAWVIERRTGNRRSVCEGCECDIDWNEDGGHNYPDGSVLCPQCEDN